MDDQLRQRFPEMTPITGPPSLSSINGIGCAVYGRRDFDPETGTYVKTHCFCFLFIPLIALGAYRVADAAQGWYFLGRVPLSFFARTWNFLLVGLVIWGVGFGFWSHHTSRPEYVAQAKLEEADQLARDGQTVEAAGLYHQVARQFPAQAKLAAEKMNLLVDPERPAAAEALVRVVPLLVELNQAGYKLDGLYDRTMALAKHHAANQPREAVQILAAVAPLAPDPRQLAELRLPLLERLLQAQPDDLEVITEVALIRESRREFDACEKLLVPHLAKLENSEGARILGQVYLAKGKLDEALKLLAPYAEERLKRYQEAETAWKNSVQMVDQRVLNELRQGKAPGFDYAGHRSADKPAQMAMVQEYLDAKLREDPAAQQALITIRQESKVVGVALDLGLIHLQLGQKQPDPAQRTAELEKAEKMFLSVRGTAGQSREYRLSLGQVYYWLGKHDQGRQQFDDLLKAEQRSSKTLADVALTLRQVGETSRARTMMEEAYEKEADANLKYHCAEARAAMSYETEERILWLSRCNQDDPQTRANLTTAQGQKAAEEGNDEAAAEQFRNAIAIYDKTPENSVTLNNCALVYLNLYRATGDPEAPRESLKRLEKALTLKPDDTVLLTNVAEQGLAQGLGEILRDQINLPLLRDMGQFHLLELLYHDAAGRDQLRDRVRKHPEIGNSLARLERVRLLAPRRPGTYRSLAIAYQQTRNLEGLRRLAKLLKETPLDLSESNRKTLERYQGKEDEKLRQNLTKGKPRLEKQLAAARKVGGATFALATGDWVSLRLYQDTLGEQVPWDELVQLAEEAVKTAPSRGSISRLNGALLFRAHKKLSQKEPAYAARAKKVERTLGAVYLIASILFRDDDPLHQVCRSHPDIQRVVAALKQEVESYPDHSEEWAWAMLRHISPETAAKMVARHPTNEFGRLNLEIMRAINPLGADYAYRQFWGLHMAGQGDQAQAILDQLAEKGVPLPKTSK